MITDTRYRKRMRRSVLRHGLLILPILSSAFSATGASAQTVNYGAMEQLFGESVTTSATGQPQRVTEVPAAMEIVTAAQIRRSGAVDIPGVLKQVPGVDVMQWASDNADVSVRGYDQAFSSRLLVLVDGRQVYADHYGYTPWSALPVELAAIRQIEVVKGPSTALFGANAVSGVINIITYNPLYDDVNAVSVTSGTQGTIRGSAVTTLQDKGSWACGFRAAPVWTMIFRPHSRLSPARSPACGTPAAPWSRRNRPVQRADPVRSGGQSFPDPDQWRGFQAIRCRRQASDDVRQGRS